MCGKIAARRDQRGEECEAVPASESFWCTGFVVIRSELGSRDLEFREVPVRLGMARWQLPASGNPPLKEQSSPSDGSPPQRYDRPLTFDVVELLWSSEVVSGNRGVELVGVVPSKRRNRCLRHEPRHRPRRGKEKETDKKIVGDMERGSE